MQNDTIATPGALRTEAGISAHWATVLQLHMAEYQSVTNRSTYWITLQYAFLPVLALFYTLAATAARSLPAEVVAWSIPVGTLLLSQTYYFALFEVYNNARYVEHTLKSVVSGLTGLRGAQYWLYDSYLRDQRSAGLMWGEYFPIAIGLAAVFAAIGLRFGDWSVSDTAGLTVSALAVVLIARQASNTVKVRQDILPNTHMQPTASTRSTGAAADAER